MDKFKNFSIDNLSKAVNDNCLEYQKKHIVNIIKSLAKHRRALDASDTGTGKTFASIFVCIELGLIPFVICPKSVISSWRKVLKILKLNKYYIINYESLQNLKYFIGECNELIKCPYLKIIKKEPINISIKREPDIASGMTNKLKKYKTLYEWVNVPDNLLLIFDEAHKCKNRISNNSEILYSAAKTKAYILMLSATIAEKPKTFVTAGYVLGLFNEIKKGCEWINNCGEINTPNPMLAVHNVIFNEYASRMKISETGNNFKKNIVEAICLKMTESEEIQKMYDLIQLAHESLKRKENASEALARLTYARMRIEILKVPRSIELTKDLYDKGYSIAIFTNYTDTINKLSIELNTNCIVYGDQSIDERSKNVELFNCDKERIILCNIKSGGFGISLHDLNGKHPRVTLIFPSYSAQDTLQSLGRIHRAGGKTDCLQYILYCKDTIEESMCEGIKDKIMNISSINNGNKYGYNIKNLIEDDNNLTEDIPHATPESLFNSLYTQIGVLHSKKDRINNELKIIDNEIIELQKKLEEFITYV